MKVTLEAMGISVYGGCRSYALPLIRSMAGLFPAVGFEVWVDDSLPELGGIENVRQMVLPIRNRFLARLALQATLPVSALRRRPDLVHYVKGMTVLGVGGKQVVTIHDLYPLIEPAIFTKSDVLYWRHIQPAVLRRVDGIIADSRRTADDVVAAYRVKTEKIDVVHLGVDAGFRPRSTQEIAPTLARRQIGPRYVLHVGAVSAKKNLVSLVRAFAILKGNGYPGQLVLVGPDYQKLERVPLAQVAEQAGITDSVRIVGAVSDDDLKDIMAGAELFAFPSKYEGFGIAVVEAMACGVPIIAARAGAVVEVVGDAAPIIDDGADFADLAFQMGLLLADEVRRQKVASACLRRASLFTWERVAHGTMAVYEKRLGASSAAH
ncbi:MAG TPA: glycosyltransferase family 1 protein [Thermoflexales bacterium]|nr:glycosyltransferase family 1 protein [Thermoflexales bacterium]HQX09629.1 glycosyltransferase family 1 protein [Thermoflexales bacterium]